MASENYRARHRGSQDDYDYDYPDERVRQASTYSTEENSKPRARAQSRSSETTQPQSLSQVPPDLVAQITEQVINNLKLSGIGTSAPPLFAQPLPKSSMNAHATTIPPRNVYTPPSPERYAGSFVSSSSDGAHTRMDGTMDGAYDRESPAKPTEKPATAASTSNEKATRPKVVERTSTGNTASTLEKIWMPLWDNEGNPTPRLGQFLRGLAIHIIEDFEPQQSIVVTPSKMAMFYEKIKAENEVYPWSEIFGGKMTNSSLSHLYRDLRCDHHFIQSQPHERPCIPGLTPVGFEKWMTHIIQAHPDLEFERFSRAVLSMPISNADNKQERFPKQLSRRLFPLKAKSKVLMDLQDAILTDPVIKLNKTPSGGQTSTTGTSNSAKENTPNLAKMSSAEDGEPRKGHNVAFNESAIDDTPPAVAIERERKPYTSQPGAGKTYEQDEGRGARADGESRRTAPAPRPSMESMDGYVERSQRPRTGSQAGKSAMPRRPRSPATNREYGGTYNRSDPDVASATYGTGMGSNLHGGESDDESRRYERERSRRYGGVEDEGSNHRRGSVHTSSYAYPPPPPRYTGS